MGAISDEIPVLCCEVEIIERDPLQEDELKSASVGAIQAIQQKDVTSVRLLDNDSYVVALTYEISFVQLHADRPIVRAECVFAVEIPSRTVYGGPHVWTRAVITRAMNDLLLRLADEALPTPLPIGPIPSDDPDIQGCCQAVAAGYLKVFPGLVQA